MQVAAAATAAARQAGHRPPGRAVALQVQRPARQFGNPLGRERLVLLLPDLDEVGVEDDVGIENLPVDRVYTAGPHGEAGVGGDPAERVVADVLRVPIGVVRLLTDLNGAGEADLLE